MLDDTKSHDHVPGSALIALVGSVQSVLEIMVIRNGPMIAPVIFILQGSCWPVVTITFEETVELHAYL
jgi:hypothetical protein